MNEFEEAMIPANLRKPKIGDEAGMWSASVTGRDTILLTGSPTERVILSLRLLRPFAGHPTLDHRSLECT